MTNVDLGQQGAKRKNDTDLLRIMRKVVMANLSVTSPARLVHLWIAELDDTLRDDAVEYAGFNIIRRVQIERTQSVQQKENKKEEKVLKQQAALVLQQKAKEIIKADIILWTMQIPGIGKPLNECTFGELETAAPLTGKFLARLAREGAPGTFIRDVFKDEEHLQDFWATCQ